MNDRFPRRAVVKAAHLLVIASLLANSAPAAQAAPVDAEPAAETVAVVPAAARVRQAPTPDSQQPREPVAPERSPASSDSTQRVEATAALSGTIYLPLVGRDFVAGPQARAELGSQAAPWLAVPGDVVTFTLAVRSSGELGMRDAVLVDRVPEELALLGAQPGAVYNVTRRELHWTLGELAPGQRVTVTLQGRVVEGAEMRVAENGATFTAQPVAQEPRPAVMAVTTATLLIGEAVTGTLTPAGGELTSPHGRVHLAAPAGAVTQTTAVRLSDHPLPEWDPREVRWLALFDVQALGEAGQALQDGSGHTRFLQSLTATLNLSGTVEWMDAYLLHCADATCQAQEHVTATYDPATEMLTATLQTFSGHGAAGRNPFPDDGSYFLFQGWPGADLYSGGVSYGIPIAAPAGPGGLGPNLSLNYSSRSVDGTLGVVQSPSVGVGWSIGGIAQITRKTEIYVKKAKPEDDTIWTFKNHFTLMIGGTSYRLYWGAATGTGCRYHTEEHSGLRVMRYNERCGYHSAYGAPPGSSNNTKTEEYWVVTTPEGTQYRFGYRADSELIMKMKKYDPSECSLHNCAWHYRGRFGGYAGKWPNRVASRWSVDRVEDVHGNLMTYRYVEEHTGSRDRAVYPAWIAYGGNAPLGSPMRYRVQFLLESRKGHDLPAPHTITGYTLWESQRVRAIRVCLGTAACETILREYVLAYDLPTLPWPGYEWIHHNHPPELTVLKTVREYGLGGQAGGAALPVLRLMYSYFDQADGKIDRREGHFGGKLRYPRLVRVENGYGGWVTFDYERAKNDHVYSYRVREKQQGDGLGNVARVTYAYGPACYADYHWRCMRSERQPRNDALWGHDWTAETARDYDGSLLTWSKHWFHNHKDEPLGREYYSEVAPSVGGVPLQVVTSTWAVTPTYGGISGRYRIDLAATESCQSGACTTTEYAYDEYGNTVAAYSLGDAAVEGDERTSRSTYVYNTADWIVSLPATEMLYEGIVTSDAPAQAKARQYLYYNDQPHGAPVQAGDLTRVDVWQLGGPYTTWYGYDGWGNQTIVTDALGHRAATTYDDIYHQFPVQACNALDQCGQTEYYGVNGPGLGVEGASFGAVYRAWGPNGQETATYSRYDGFGRVVRVVAPGDTWAYPTTTFEYHDGAYPGLWALARQREESSVPGTLDYYVFHDGLGRLLQTRAEVATGWSVTSQRYDALGRVVRGYLPQLVAGSVYTAPVGAYAETVYDALGRAVEVINPDGTRAETQYDGWTTTTIDPNRHQRVAVNDAYGQLVRVEEYTGTVESGLALYATTRYGYDVLGNLTVVSDTNGVTTRMTYDDLGRKVAMNDPDMGRWEYSYDVLGNLVWQRDALSQTLTFEYDELSRLASKSASGQVLAAYGYDEGVYGIGQRTSMGYPGGAVAHRYDARGRVIEETRTFADASTPLSTSLGDYTTAYTYDALDRGVTTVYPDGEVVTQTYDGGGMAYGLQSSLGEEFVTETVYDASGQMTKLALGNSVQTVYGYDPLTLRLAWIKTGPADQPGLHQHLEYAYDDVGNVLRIDDLALGEVQTFAYDPLDRLVAAQASGLITATYARAYGYDPTGNIAWRVNEGEELAYGYHDPAHVHAVTAVTRTEGTDRYEYDGNGNMTLRVEISGTETITYHQIFDVENRLVAVTMTTPVSQTVTRFGYDGDGARVWKWRSGEDGTTVYVGEQYEEFVPGVDPRGWTPDGGISMLEAGSSLARTEVGKGERAAEQRDGRIGKPGVAALRLGPSTSSGRGSGGAGWAVEQPGRPTAGGTMHVSTGGDFRITVHRPERDVCKWFALNAVTPPAGRLFEGDDSQDGRSATIYVPSGTNVVLAFYHWADSSKKSVCMSHVPQPVYSTAGTYVDLSSRGPDSWRVKFEDADMSSTRDLKVDVYRRNTLAPPAWVDTGPDCTGAADRTVGWNAVKGWWYEVQRAGDISFTTGVLSATVQASGSTASHTFTGHATGAYYYRVRALGRSGSDPSGWSSNTTASHDLAPPVTTHTLTGTLGLDGWYTSPVIVGLNAADAGCGGVAGTAYRLDSAGWTTYTAPFAVSGDGAHTVVYSSTDTVGNVEDAHSLGLQIDTAAPANWSAFSPSGWTADLTPTVSISVRDATSGLDVGTAQVRVSTDEGANWSSWLPDSCTGTDGATDFEIIAATVALAEGVQNRVQFRVRDVAGNLATSGEQTVRVNASAPDGWRGFSPSGWTADLTPTVSISVRDEAPGLDVHSAQVSTDGGETWQPAFCSGVDGSTDFETITATVVFTQAGTGNRVAFRIEDQLGNLGESDPQPVWIDTTPPTVTLTAPRRVVTNTFTVTWSAEDAQAGLAHYDLDLQTEGGPWQRILTTTTLTNYQFTDLPGTHFAFRVTATDNVGNAGSTEARTSVVVVTKYYTHGGRRVAMRQVSAGEGSVIYYLHTDHLGSTSLTTDAGGGVVARQLYHPYGTVRYSVGTLTTDFGFTGQRQDPTGLIYMHARYYHPGLGRFTQPDTLVPGSDNPRAFNRYAYVENNPVLYNDPTGHVINLGFAVAGAVIGALTGAIASAGPQMIQNIRDGQPLTANIDPGQVAKDAAIGAAVGAVGGLTFGVGLAAGGAIAGAIGVSSASGAAASAIGVGTVAVSGAAAGQASRATENVLRGREISEGLFQPEDMLLDAATSVVLFKAFGGSFNEIAPGTGGSGSASRVTRDSAGRWRTPDGRFARNPNAPQRLAAPSTGRVHGNRLDCPRRTWLYKLVHRDTGQVMKYGETVASNPVSRYGTRWLDANNVDLVPMAIGPKSYIHELQFTLNTASNTPWSVHGW